MHLNFTNLCNSMLINYLFSFFLPLFIQTHPFYVSVIDVLHNTTNKSAEVTVKIYTDDFEATLKKNYGKHFDLITPANKEDANAHVADYIKKHVTLQIDGVNKPMNYIGYEKNEASIWAYFEIPNIAEVKKVHVNTNLLFDYIDKQNNIIHVTYNGSRKSKRLSFPEKEAAFIW
jgi:hypothetical protein